MRSLPQEKRKEFLASLSEAEAALLLADWRFWARKDQLPPAGEWTTWAFIGGRGAGKTRAGAEWIAAEAAEGRAAHIALIAETLADARDVMIEGVSGIRAIAPAGLRPRFETTKRRLVFPNGAVAQIFSAEDPDSIRGPQFDCAWADASLTVVTAASAVTALTPTPRDDQWIGKIYRVVEFLTFNFGRAKQIAPNRL